MNVNLQGEQRGAAFTRVEKVCLKRSFGTNRKPNMTFKLKGRCRNLCGRKGKALRRLSTGKTIVPLIERDVNLVSATLVV